MARYRDQPIIGGTFTNAQGGPAMSRVSRWDGSAWNGSSWSTITGAGTSPITAIAQYTTASGFEVMADGFTDRGWQNPSLAGAGEINVYALAVHDGDLIAGGNFTHSGATRTRRIARWNGSTWSEADGGFNRDVYALLG